MVHSAVTLGKWIHSLIPFLSLRLRRISKHLTGLFKATNSSCLMTPEVSRANKPALAWTPSSFLYDESQLHLSEFIYHSGLIRSHTHKGFYGNINKSSWKFFYLCCFQNQCFRTGNAAQLKLKKNAALKDIREMEVGVGRSRLPQK